MATEIVLNRFLQDTGMGHCSVCASVSLANYYDSRINYEIGKKLARKISKVVDNEGLYSGEVGYLLNKLGMKKVTIVTSDMNYLDYTWSKLSKKNLIDRIVKKSQLFKKKGKTFSKHYQGECKSIIRFLKNKGFSNKLVIDYHFGKHIRKSIDEGKPVMIMINWTMFFKSIKFYKDEPDDLRGVDENHAVLVYDYDKAGVYILDSREYCGKHKQFEDGKYFMSWEQLMTVLGFGDIILADKIDPKIVDKLV